MRVGAVTIFAWLLFVACDKTFFEVESGMREVASVPVVIGNGSQASYPKEVDYPVVPEDHPALICMRKKAHQIADIEWTPLKDIPGLTKPIPAGITRVGIPYSSVKEKDKFVGQEVSFHTFMTALNNPRSVLYTEDVKEPPYNGTNCGPYYGTVCSGAVNYALGIARPYQSHMYEFIPYIAKVKNQSPESICSGDILWSPGHVVLVIDIKKDGAGNPSRYMILESAGKTAIKNISLASFKKRWDADGWIAYRNMHLAENVDYTPNPYTIFDGETGELSATYNNDICTSRGDMVTYMKGEEVIINVLNPAFKTVEVVKDGVPLTSLPISTEDITLHSLEPGSYAARLHSGNSTSKDVLFEIIDENTSVRKHGEKYAVSFSSTNGVPVYLVVCSRTGARKAIVDITPEDLSIGGLLLSGNYSGLYLKVFYQGKYGRVSNEPIKL